jgi:amidase
MSHQPFRNELGVTVRTKAVIALGEFQYNTEYRAALGRQAQWEAVIGRVLKEVDFIALPTLQNLPPRLPPFGGTVAFEARVLGMQNTAAVNFGRVPALAIPVPSGDKAVPLTSVQLIGPPRSEAALLNAGRLIEASRAPRGS